MTINFHPLLLRPRAAAQRLGISIEALRNEVERGAIQQMRVGRMLYFRPEDLLAYVERLAEVAHSHRQARKGIKPTGREGGQKLRRLADSAAAIYSQRKRRCDSSK
jgi:hypothetical protein